MQDDGAFHSIAYPSWTVLTHEKKYGINELEALGVVWALKHFSVQTTPNSGDTRLLFTLITHP